MENAHLQFYLDYDPSQKDRIKKSARSLNLLSGKKDYFASSFICLDHEETKKWSRDFLKIKELICSLRERMGIKADDYYRLFNMSPELIDLLCQNQSKWVSSFFRPDCMLTEQGPRLFELNIDNSSMAFSTGLSSKNFYKSDKLIREYIEKKYGFGLDQSFGAEREFVNYLSRIQFQGKKIQIWDLPGRTEAQKRERDELLQFYRTQGLSIVLLESEAIPPSPEVGVYTFQFFAYIHFTNHPEHLRTMLGAAENSSLGSGDFGFSSITYDNKINMALLWSSDIQKLLTSEEVQLITKYLPKTYALNWLTASQIAAIRASREDWVIKAGTGSEGLDVHVGSEVSQEEWRDIVEDALKRGNSIAQERITPLKLEVDFTDGRHDFAATGPHVLNFYFVNNKFSGLFFRMNRDEKVTKVGEIDSFHVLTALPLLIQRDSP